MGFDPHNTLESDQTGSPLVLLQETDPIHTFQQDGAPSNISLVALELGSRSTLASVYSAATWTLDGAPISLI